jgi:hypothetical protein
MSQLLNDMDPAELVKGLMSPQFQERAAVMQERLLFDQERKDEEKELLIERAKAVLDNSAGHALLKDLTIRTLSRSVFPPPSGCNAGEYAAQRQGQIDMVAWLISLIGDE